MDDGTFWMAAEDFVQLSRDVRYNITFGPTWQCVAQYGNFGKAASFTAIAKNNYRACDNGEVSFKRGDTLEVTMNHGGSWLKGVHQPTGKKGYFRKKDVDMKCADTFKYELSVSNITDYDQIIIALFRQNIEKMRKWYARKQDGKHYKDTEYSDAYLYVYGSNDKRLVKLHVDEPHDWHYLKPSLGPFKIYVSCKATDCQRFALYAFAPRGELRLKQLECDRRSWMTEVGARSTVDNMREALYTQTTDTVNEYMHLGYQLLNDYPQAAHVAQSVMDVASTVGEYLDVEDASDRVMDFVNSDRVQNVADQVQDLIQSDAARELTDQVGNLVSRASSWLGRGISGSQRFAPETDVLQRFWHSLAHEDGPASKESPWCLMAFSKGKRITCISLTPRAHRVQISALVKK